MFNADEYSEKAILERCPCDSSLAILDFTQLPPLEKQKLRRDNQDKPSNGSGNALIGLPTRTNTDCYDDGVKYGCPVPIATNRNPDNLPRVVIMDTGLENVTKTQLEQQARYEIGRNFVGGLPTEVGDGIGHGTAVTGIADQASQGNASYLIYKTHDDKGVGTVFSITCALRCAAYVDSADIVNMSFGGYVKSSTIYNEIDTIKSLARPPLLIASSGNDGVNTSEQFHIPSGHPAVMEISATYLSLSTSSATTGAQQVFNLAPDYPNGVLHWTCSNYNTDGTLITAPGVFLVDNGQNVTERAAGTSFSAAFATGKAVAFMHGYQVDDANMFRSYVLNSSMRCNTKNGDKFFFRGAK